MAQRSLAITLHAWLAATFVVAATPLSFFGQATSTTLKKQSVSQDLTQVPELALEPALLKPIDVKTAHDRITAIVNKANQLNKQELDGFVRDLRKRRADLEGLPFLMGGDCKMAENCLRPFAAAGEGVHQALESLQSLPTTPSSKQGATLMGLFQRAYWEANTKHDILPVPDGFAAQVLLPQLLRVGLYVHQGVEIKKAGPELAKKPVALGQIAALMQVLAPEAPELLVGLAEYLGRMPHREATRALAKLAVFSEEVSVRETACKALQPRSGDDYADVLVTAFHYPWPSVAVRATEAVVQLKRTELIPQLIDMLERPDPRSPYVKENDGKKGFQIRELVRINHHRNCTLCHAPGNTPDVPKDAIKAAIAVPGEPLPSFQGYQSPLPDSDHVVRLDVTYLRQDFSRYLPVADAAPWPEKQRFDFLIRTRILTEEEAKTQRDSLQPPQAGTRSPYHQAAVAALRELTGHDAAPNAAGWRKALGIRKAH